MGPKKVGRSRSRLTENRARKWSPLSPRRTAKECVSGGKEVGNAFFRELFQVEPISRMGVPVGL